MKTSRGKRRVGEGDSRGDVRIIMIDLHCMAETSITL